MLPKLTYLNDFLCITFGKEEKWKFCMELYKHRQSFMYWQTILIYCMIMRCINSSVSIILASFNECWWWCLYCNFDKIRATKIVTVLCVAVLLLWSIWAGESKLKYLLTKTYVDVCAFPRCQIWQSGSRTQNQAWDGQARASWWRSRSGRTGLRSLFPRLLHQRVCSGTQTWQEKGRL